jgi:hypothetical protein
VEDDTVETNLKPYLVYSMKDEVPSYLTRHVTIEEAKEAWERHKAITLTAKECYIYNADTDRVVWRSNPAPEEQETAQLMQRVSDLEERLAKLEEQVDRHFMAHFGGR